jgi:Zn-dependent protease
VFVPHIDAARIIAVATILLVSFPVHEFSHALAAYRLGDSTARLFGRLTLNPIAHFDPTGGFMLILTSLIGFGVGYAKPTPVNPNNLRGGRYGEAIVAFAGPASNLVVAAAAALPFRVIFGSATLQAQVPSIVLETLFIFIYINLLLMVFNLLPIPPLDGSKVLFAFMDPRTVWRVRPVLERYGIFILLFAVFFPIGPSGSIFTIVFRLVVNPLLSLLLGTDLFLG